MASLVKCSRAFVRAFDAELLASSALRTKIPGQPIRPAVLKAQHDAYTAQLRKLVPDVTELPAATPAAADGVFIEDTAVIVRGTAVITRPGAPSRRHECEGVKAALAGSGLTIVELAAPALLDGGDVLFTGHEVFVGLTRRTNQAGVDALAAALPGVPVTPIFVGHGPKDSGRHSSRRRGVLPPDAATIQPAGDGEEGESFLHLKSVVTMLSPWLMVAPATPLGMAIAESICLSSKLTMFKSLGQQLQYVTVPDAACANVLVVNDTCIMPAGYPASRHVLQDVCGADAVVELDMSEFAKADGALTCCSLLVPDHVTPASSRPLQ